MIKLDTFQHLEYIPWAEKSPCNQVYPLSIAENRQFGDIYVDDTENPKLVLFWHYCGFAYLSGSVSDQNLREIADNFCHRSKRRMVLITDDDFTVGFFRKRNVTIANRIEYDYAGGCLHDHGHTELEIRRIDEKNIRLITGRIIPTFFWEEKQFLKDGFGYAAFEQNEFRGVAFSAAVSSAEVDVGVEVKSDSQGRGIASMLVNRMCDEIVAQGKKPVWAHAESNIASMRTAFRCGFTKKKVNRFCRLKQEE